MALSKVLYPFCVAIFLIAFRNGSVNQMPAESNFEQEAGQLLDIFCTQKTPSESFDSFEP